MSNKTLKMAKQLYQQMSDYFGSNHEQRCVEFINFTLSSMETEIDRFRAERDEWEHEHGLLKLVADSETEKLDEARAEVERLKGLLRQNIEHASDSTFDWVHWDHEVREALGDE